MFFENSSELAQHKLILLYIIDKIEYSVTNSEITRFVLENNHMNYFQAQQYLSEMVSSKLLQIITKNGYEYYELTNKGNTTLNCFNNRIPIEIKNRIDEKYKKTKEEKIKETQIIGNYYKKDKNQYIVNLKVIENEKTLFSLSIDVVSVKQAKMICKKWKANPQIIYKNIIDMLTEK